MADRGRIKQLREQERAGEIREALRVCSSRMSLPLYMAFWFADLVYAPHLMWDLLVLRALMIPICFLISTALSRADTLERVERVCLLFTLANSGLITLMIYLTEGIASPYYAGLTLVAVGILAFFPWSRRMLPYAILTIFGPYYLIGLLLRPSSHEWVSIGLYSFFIAGTVIASLVKYHFTEQLRFREISARIRLQEEIESRERIIREKTEEALNLSTLTRQFSPQVVHAIRTGRLEVLNGSRRSHICAIFIDIVDSTDHVVRIDINEISVVLSMFMEDTMRVLLKYDITIDKFLGDGVLAFSNAPVQHDDFIERVVNAALEIRLRIQSRRVVYMDHWRNDLQIRVGIATGYANVGFFGSDEYFRSYTAIGRVVNLASRLCAAAQPDQILVCEAVADRLAASSYEVSYVGRPVLKGFEREPIAVFEVLGAGHAAEEVPEIYTCPQQHGVLHLDNAGSGIYVFKCRECGFVLDFGQEKAMARRLPAETHAKAAHAAEAHAAA